MALAGGILVELVEDHEDQRLGRAQALLFFEHALQGGSHHEALGPVVERVDVDDRGLGSPPVEAVLLALPDVAAADEMAHMGGGAHEPALEGGGGARGGARPLLGPRLVGAVLTAIGQKLHEGVEALEAVAVDLDPGVVGGPRACRLLGELGGHAVDHERELARGVVGLGEEKRDEPLGHELAERPEEGGDALLAAARVG